MKANRLDMLIYQIDLELKKATAEVEQLINSQLIGRGYDEIERQAGILGDTVTRNMQIDVETIAHASFHSAKWSDRVWKNNNEVRAKISNAMRQYVVQGIPTSKALKALEKMVKSNVSNASYAARRIIVTERQRVAAEVQTKIYEEAGVKWIKFITEPGCCEICRDLDGKVFKIEDAEAGSNMRPMHPNCRCSTTMANAPADHTGDPFDEWLETFDEHGLTYSDWLEKQRTASRMAAEDDDLKWPDIPDSKKPISSKEFKDIRGFINACGLRQTGFKKFRGEVQLFKEFTEKAQKVASKFPNVFNGKNVELIYDNTPLNSNDFAFTSGNGKEIIVPDYLFRSKKALEDNYNAQAELGEFVKGTNFKSILVHEMGHVVEIYYGINAVEIAEMITGISSVSETMDYLTKKLSFYSVGGKRFGDEITAEVFSDFFNRDNPSEFSMKFMAEIDRIVSDKEAS